MRKWLFVLSLATMLLAIGCGDVDVPDHPDPFGHRDGGGEDATSRDPVNAGTERVLKTREVKFDPGELWVKVGVPTVLTLENLDDVEHDFQIDEIDAAIIQGEYEGNGPGGGAHSGGDLSVHAEAGETDAIKFVVHEAGVYEFYCTVSGHREAGMVGTLTAE